MKKYILIVFSLLNIESISIASEGILDYLLGRKFIRSSDQEVQQQQNQEQQQFSQAQQPGKEEQLQQQVDQLLQKTKLQEEMLKNQRIQFLQQQQEVYGLKEQLWQNQKQEEERQKASWFSNPFASRFITTEDWERQQREQEQKEQPKQKQRELEELGLLKQGLSEFSQDQTVRGLYSSNTKRKELPLSLQQKHQAKEKIAETSFVDFLPNPQALKTEIEQLRIKVQELELQIKNKEVLLKQLVRK